MNYSTIKKSTFFFFLLFISSFQGFSQSNDVTTLLNQKQEAIKNGENCISINQELYKLGHVPKALVEDLGNNKISFFYHQSIPPSKTERINDRLKANYSFFNYLVIDTENSLVLVEFNTLPTDQMIGEIVSHFAFDGYEKK